ncbi:MAG: alpha/beta hydrolase, partial [Terriglobales bacterium]
MTQDVAQTQTAGTPVVPVRRKKRWIRWLKRIALGAIGLVVLVGLAGTVYEWLASRADGRRFPQQGRSVEVGGFRLHIDCAGTAPPGTPTVILESGGGVPALGWKFVQPGIAQFTKVCSYDRAGYGWSDPPVDPLRTSLQIAKELHALLQNANVPPPYVLVGHSLGGFNIRVYNGQYPDEVAGAVFVDSSHPDQLQRATPGLKKLSDKSLKSFRWQVVLFRVAIDCGAMRLLQRSARKQQTLPLDFMEELEYLQRKEAFITAAAGEVSAFEEGASQVRNSRNFGNKPVIVLTAGKFPEVPGISKEESNQFLEIWIHELQPQLAQLSTRGKQVVVPDSDH